MADGHATEMRAYARDDEPFGLLHTILVRLRVDELGEIDILGLLNFLRRPPADEDRFSLPHHGNDLTRYDG